jgi:hypothetical protein
MIHMLAVAPDPWISESTLTGTGTDDGVPSDASIEVRLSSEQTLTLRTLVRLGERIGSAGLPHGTMTDAVSVAALAVSSLMLQAIPAHADLGDRVLAAWGTGDLPPVLHHMQLVELPS